MTMSVSDKLNFIPTFQQNEYKSRDEETKSSESIEISDSEKAENKKKAEEAREKMLRESEMDMLEKQLESSNEEAESTAEGFAAFGKCLTIAQRITRGDNVPQKDIKYLMEKEPDLYKQAIMLRRPNNDPKDYESVLEDEDNESSVNEAEASSEGSSLPIEEGAIDVSTGMTISE